MTSFKSDLLNSTRSKLDEINNQQINFKKILEKVATKNEFQSLKGKLLSQQLLLSEVNRELIGFKKNIKLTKEFQESQCSQDNNNANKDLIKQAKELIVQKKYLLKLLNTQKELNVEITNLSTKFPTNASPKKPCSVQKTTKSLPLKINTFKTQESQVQDSHPKDEAAKPGTFSLSRKNHPGIVATAEKKHKFDLPKPKQYILPEAKSIVIWGDNGVMDTSLFLPANFWEVGFESVDLFEQLMK